MPDSSGYVHLYILFSVADWISRLPSHPEFISGGTTEFDIFLLYLLLPEAQLFRPSTDPSPLLTQIWNINDGSSISHFDWRHSTHSSRYSLDFPPASSKAGSRQMAALLKLSSSSVALVQHHASKAFSDVLKTKITSAIRCYQPVRDLYKQPSTEQRHHLGTEISRRESIRMKDSW
jgi:hypothetical protein